MPFVQLFFINILVPWFEPKSGQTDILDSNTQNNRVARLIFISKEYEQSVQYYSIAVSNHVWIHSANPLFNIQRNTLTVPTFSCVNKISLISMEYKNMSFHVSLTPPFSARNSIVLSFVWFQCNTLLTSIHLSIYPSYLHTVKKFRTMLDHFNFRQKSVRKWNRNFKSPKYLQ